MQLSLTSRGHCLDCAPLAMRVVNAPSVMRAPLAWPEALDVHACTCRCVACACAFRLAVVRAVAKAWRK